MRGFDLDRVAAGRPRFGPNNCPVLHVDDHPAFLPLGVCYHAASLSKYAPLVPSWATWCVLSRLYGMSDRQRIGSYRQFWRAVHSADRGTQPDYARSSAAHSAWHGLLYSVELQPHMSIMAVMYDLSAAMRQ